MEAAWLQGLLGCDGCLAAVSPSAARLALPAARQEARLAADRDAAQAAAVELRGERDTLSAMAQQLEGEAASLGRQLAEERSRARAATEAAAQHRSQAAAAAGRVAEVEEELREVGGRQAAGGRQAGALLHQFEAHVHPAPPFHLALFLSQVLSALEQHKMAAAAKFAQLQSVLQDAAGPALLLP